MMILYRPVGLKEMELIAQSGFKSFPPRLAWQPIFYPVLNFEYAEQIARDWNTSDKASSFCGFVTRWEIDDEFIKQYEVQTVGARTHQELWIPSESLDGFNQSIIGEIEIVGAYYGEQFEGERDPQTNLPASLMTKL